MAPKSVEPDRTQTTATAIGNDKENHENLAIEHENAENSINTTTEHHNQVQKELDIMGLPDISSPEQQQTKLKNYELLKVEEQVNDTMKEEEDDQNLQLIAP